MAEKIIKTKIKLRYDVLSAWTTANPTLQKGEVAIVAIPTDSKELNINGTTPPQILFKVGPGEFNKLPYASGKAADVYSWAKAEKLTIAKSGDGNVVSGIEWDASANEGKGGIKFTTTSVATSAELKGVQDRLAAIEGTGEQSRITLLEEGLAATDKLIADSKDAWAANTTYTFSQNGKSFTVTPSEGEAKTITFDYLTATEVASAIEKYGYQNAEAVKAIVESYKYTTVESLNNYYTKTEADGKFLTEHQSLANYYNKTEVDGLVSPKADKSYVDEELGKKVDSTTYSDKISSIEGRLNVVEGENGIAGIKESIGDIQLDIEELDGKFEDYYTATQVDGFLGGKADKTELASYETVANADLVRGRVSTLEGHFAEGGRVTEAESKISTLEGAVETIMNGTDASKIDSLNDLIEWADEHAPEVASIKEGIEANAEAIKGLKGSKADKADLDNYYNKDTIDGKVSALEGQISGVDGKLASYETLEAANAVRDRVTTVEGKVKTLEETTIPGINATIDTLATKAEVKVERERIDSIVNTTIPTLATKAEVKEVADAVKVINETTIPTLATKEEVSKTVTGINETIATLATKSELSSVEGKVDGVIADYLKAADKTELEGKINNKQDTINDLEAIRSGAAAGATAVQQSDIADMLTKTEAEGIYETKANVTAVSNRVTAVENEFKTVTAEDGTETKGRVVALEDKFADWAIIWDCGGAN